MKIDMEKFVRERDEALLSLDKEKIQAYLRKYGVDYEPESDLVWWAGIHKSILCIRSATPEQVERSKKWLVEHGLSRNFEWRNRVMNCHVCGKKICAGYALCGECGKHLGDGVLTQTRLGRFVQHPEELAAAISIVDAPWCKPFEQCAEYIESADYNENAQEEKCKKCALNWLMEDFVCNG